jgi:hypothetical protein
MSFLFNKIINSFLTENYKWINGDLYKDGVLISTDSVSDEEVADAEELGTVGISGEYWFDENGSTMYADGDVGDMNHEAYVIQTCISQLAGEFDIWVDAPHLESDSPLENEIVEAIIDELDIEDEEAKEAKIEDIKNDPASAMIDYLVQNTKMEMDAASDLVLNAYGSKGDAREYAIKNWNWSRVQGDSIETLKLTAGALKTIARGINNALEEEGLSYDHEDNPEVLELHEYTISTYSGKRYTITLADMEKGNVSGLEQDIAVAVSAATQQVKKMDIEAMPDYYKQKGIIGDSFQQFFQERYGQNVVNEMIEIPNRKFWMSPVGKFVFAKAGQQHNDVAEDIMQGKPVNDSAYYTLMADGWQRGALVRNAESIIYLNNTINISPSLSQKTAIKDLAIYNEIDHVIWECANAKRQIRIWSK